MKVADFDYHLPEELIAQHPVEPRDASRLLVVRRAGGPLDHRLFHDLPDYLRSGDVLVLNETKVLPARIFAHKPTGARIEVVLLKQVGLDSWEVLVKPGRKVLPGSRLIFSPGELTADVTGMTEAGGRTLHFHCQSDFFQTIERIGRMPLPPYIREELADGSRYQTVYARERGSAAAPTAGLHFTPELLAELEQKGVHVAKVLLHVGLGTFRPVKAEEVTDHQMHAEYYQISQETADLVNQAKAAGGRVVSVGTTSTRTLETVADESGTLQAGEGWTSCFIYPGYRFKVVDAIVTNFHLPKSTLLMLVAAFAGHERTMAAYREAVEEGYRFFSFGDAMLLLP